MQPLLCRPLLKVHCKEFIAAFRELGRGWGGGVRKTPTALEFRIIA